MLRFSPRLTLSLIKSGVGDCIHIRFAGKSGRAGNLVIDSGPSVTAPAFRTLYNNIIRTDGLLDCVILTHYDEDHIGGLLSLSKSTKDLQIGRICLNGVMPDRPESAPPAFLFSTGLSAFSSRLNLSPSQNQELVHTLTGMGAAIDTVMTAGKEICLDGARLMVIAPDDQGLREAKRRMEEEEAKTKESGVRLSGECDWNRSLDELMDAKPLSGDTSVSNRASIVLIFEYEGYRFLFTGDAPAASIGKGLKNGKDQRFDLVKLPHHGSARNISDRLLASFYGKAFLICGDGRRHPDKETVARVLKRYGRAVIYGNYSWWRNGFFCDEDQKYLDNGTLQVNNIADRDMTFTG